jgi:hypothetical protein
MINVVHGWRLTSGAARVNGRAAYIGGYAGTTYQIAGPAALGGISISNDLLNWEDAIPAAATVVADIEERPLWVRPYVDIDGSAPRVWTFRLVTHKEAR